MPFCIYANYSGRNQAWPSTLHDFPFPGEKTADVFQGQCRSPARGAVEGVGGGALSSVMGTSHGAGLLIAAVGCYGPSSASLHRSPSQVSCLTKMLMYKQREINQHWLLFRLMPEMCSAWTLKNRNCWRSWTKWKELMVLICTGSGAAKWLAIQEAAHFWMALGKKTELSEEQGSQVASSLKQRKIQIGCLCCFTFTVLSRKRHSYKEVLSMREIRNPQGSSVRE